MFDRAEWDAESGLGVARLQIGIEAADPIEPATQVVSPGVVEHAADPIVPVARSAWLWATRWKWARSATAWRVR